MRKFLIFLAILLALLCGAVLSAWFMRGAIAKSVIANACEDRGLTCSVETAEISLNAVTLAGLNVRDLSGTHVATTDLQAALDWPSLFSPSISALNLNNDPKLSVTYTEDGFFLGNVPLTSLLSGETGGAPAPSLSVERGELTLSTPAGTLIGTVSANGDFPSTGRIEAVLQPAQLRQDAYSLTLNQGALNITLDETGYEGALTLVIEEASLPGQSVSKARLSATLPRADQPRLDWQLTAKTLSDARFGRFSDVDAAGETDLFPSAVTNPSNPISAIRFLTAKVETGPSSAFERTADALELTLFAERQNAQDSFDIQAEAAFSSGAGAYGTAERATFTLAGQAADDGSTFALSGRAVASGVAASPRAKTTLTNTIPTTPPFAAHGQALREALARALDGFSASAGFGLTKPKNDSFTFTLNGPVALKAQSGANLLLTPEPGKPALVSGPGGTTVSGLISSRGGGFPDATVLLRDLQQTETGLRVRTGGINLKDWRIGGTTLAMDLTGLTVQQNNAGNLQISSNGSLRFDGPLLGVAVSDGELFGRLDAVRTPTGWRVQTHEQSCIGLEYTRLRLARDLSLGASALRLCPPDGRVLSSNRDGVSGALNLGAVSLPIEGNRFDGRIGLSDADLNWNGSDTLTLALTANAIDLPLKIDGRDLRITSDAASLRIRIADALAVNGALGPTSLSGALVPANIDMSSLTLTGEFAGKGFQGGAQGSNVRVSDYRADPIYQPLLGTLNARLDGADMDLSGPFRLARTGTFVGDLDADINLLTLTGKASMDIPSLTFARGALQPKDVSEQLRGLLTRAEGSAQGRADLVLTNGALTGTGRFSISNFSLETFRLGPVTGINGEIYFSDLIGLSTPPGQTFTIERMNPGLPLENGTLQFQITGGREARLETARWPFAGGQLTVAPSLWTIAGTQDTVEVRADRIELKNLIETLKVPDLEAEGTVSGVFPIELRAGSTFIKNARFKVDEEGGRLSYKGQALSNVGGPNQTVNDAFRALQDFRYTVLELTLNGNLLGDITLGALLIGKNPDVLGGSEFEFDISIDSKLAQLLQTGREAGSSQWLAEAVARQIEEENAPQD